MKTEGIESIPNGGLRISTSIFARLKAFQGGGDYWDHQELIRESLGDFLPPVQQIQEAENRFGVFRKDVAGKEVLCKSTSMGSTRVPEEQVRRLTSALDAFKRKADDPDTQQNAKEIIQHFRLPDISKDPDLYRLCGPWWDRKLQVIWGCERIPDSSLAPVAAVAKLPIDKAYGFKRALSLLALLLLLCAFLAACLWGWPTVKWCYGKAFNKPPIAALRLESVDETNRIATISDSSSHHPAGTLKYWRIVWGDGKEDSFKTSPQNAAHTYASERDYTISLWCVDNYNATSSPPALTNISFALLKRQKAFEQTQLDAQREADRIKEEAKKEAAKVKEEVQKQKDLATQQAQDTKKEADQLKEDAQKQKALAAQQTQAAKNEQELADKKKAAAVLAQQDAKKAQEAADQARTTPPPVVRTVPLSTQPPQVQSSTPQQQASIQPTAPQPDPNPGDLPSPEPPAGAPSRPEPPGKGATDLLRPEPEIVKGRVGRLAADNTLEAILVVRDRAHPNTSLDVVEWVVDGKANRSGNAQLTTRLSITEHIVSVKVRRTGIEQTARAKVVVTGAETQTTEPDFTVRPLR
jgi:PKD repeat protein